MKAFVFWTAMVSLLSAAGLQFPAISMLLMPTQQIGMLSHVFGLMAMFIGIALCSRPTRSHRRLGGHVAIGRFCRHGRLRTSGDGGLPMLSAAGFDLVVGLIYLIALPRHLRTSLTSLLFDASPQR